MQPIATATKATKGDDLPPTRVPPGTQSIHTSSQASDCKERSTVTEYCSCDVR